MEADAEPRGGDGGTGRRDAPLRGTKRKGGVRAVGEDDSRRQVDSTEEGRCAQGKKGYKKGMGAHATYEERTSVDREAARGVRGEQKKAGTPKR
jgi:hypothetical protein